MEWTKEEQDALISKWHVATLAGTIKEAVTLIASCAVELMAARGGTMEDARDALSTLVLMAPRGPQRDEAAAQEDIVIARFAAINTRIAALEAERDAQKADRDALSGPVLEDEKELADAIEELHPACAETPTECTLRVALSRLADGANRAHALRQHVSEIETSLENARKERDEVAALYAHVKELVISNGYESVAACVAEADKAKREREAVRAELEIAKRPASFEMEKELERALAERDQYRHEMLSDGGKFLAEMQRADRLNDEANQLRAERDALNAEVARVSKEGTAEAARIRADLQTMTDLRDGYRKAGALEHERAEKAEVQIQAIRHRAAEATNIERFIAEKSLPAAMRWVVDGEATQNDKPRCASSRCLVNWSLPPTRACGFCDSCCGHARGICATPKRLTTTTDGDFTRTRFPCSPTCTHDDAANPGHPERVNSLSGAVVVATELADPCARRKGTRCAIHTVDDSGPSEDFERGAEAMRAACWEAVQRVATTAGAHGLLPVFKAAIEGATL